MRIAEANVLNRKPSLRRAIGLVAMFVLACAISLLAQSTNASLTGRVTDPTRAVLPEAKVIVIKWR